MTSGQRSVIRVRGLKRSFRAPGQGVVTALQDVSLDVFDHGFVSIAGPSGSGKTTLLGLIGCLDRPTDGSLQIGGVDVGGASERTRAKLRSTAVGFVFQRFHLLEARSAIDNVTVGAMYQGLSKNVKRERARGAIKKVRLSHRSTFGVRYLSGGERQRVAIARAITKEPAILLCDEPTGNLDDDSAAAVIEILEDLSRQGTAVVIATHDPRVTVRTRERYRLHEGVLITADAE